MKKRTGIVVVLITLILTGLMYFTAIQGWGPTGTGAASNIHTGLDLSGIHGY